MKTRIHAIAGAIGFFTILTFWTSTVISELFGSYETITFVKAMILKGMFILIPSMMIVGGSGMALGGKRTDALASAKKKRMPIIGANGLLILLPLAFILASKAAAGDFDNWFYELQAVELIAGGVNLTLMSLNMRDGLRMTGRSGKARSVKMTDRQILTDDTMLLRFDKPEGFDHKAGQWARLSLADSARTLTIASAPHEAELAFATKLSNSDFKQALKGLPLGGEIELTGPDGSLILPQSTDRPLVFLACGIGITPFLSMVRHAVEIGSGHRITLFYSNRNAKDAVFLDEFGALEASAPDFKLVATMTDNSSADWQGEAGYIDEEMLGRHLQDTRAPIYYIVGSPSKVTAMRAILRRMNVAKQDILTEEFSGY